MLPTLLAIDGGGWSLYSGWVGGGCRPFQREFARRLPA